MGKRVQKSPPPDDPHDPNRTGLFTSGVVATRTGRRIAIFFSGRQHAGENLSDVLDRSAELDASIHMCEGLSRPSSWPPFWPIAWRTGDENSLADRFTDQCRYVIDALQVVYHNSEDRIRRMSADERLAYHQAHSQVDHGRLENSGSERQFDEKLVEPNSALGKRSLCLFKRWDALVVLTQGGCPFGQLTSVNAHSETRSFMAGTPFFIRLARIAHVGDIYMTLIYTCELNGADALDYLKPITALTPRNMAPASRSVDAVELPGPTRRHGRCHGQLGTSDRQQAGHGVLHLVEFGNWNSLYPDVPRIRRPSLPGGRGLRVRSSSPHRRRLANTTGPRNRTLLSPPQN